MTYNILTNAFDTRVKVLRKTARSQ